MKSGYSLVWTERAQHDLKNIINYLKANWTQRELQRFSRKLDQRIQLLISNPLLLPASEKKKKFVDPYFPSTPLFITRSEKTRSGSCRFSTPIKIQKNQVFEFYGGPEFILITWLDHTMA